MILSFKNSRAVLMKTHLVQSPVKGDTDVTNGDTDVTNGDTDVTNGDTDKIIVCTILMT